MVIRLNSTVKLNKWTWVIGILTRAAVQPGIFLHKFRIDEYPSSKKTNGVTVTNIVGLV